MSVVNNIIFRARQLEWVFPRPTLVMGIVNVTPDSFSDGGRYFDAQAAVARGLELAAQGAATGLSAGIVIGAGAIAGGLAFFLGYKAFRHLTKPKS